jgi:FkbM family methyltransferase
MRPLRPLHKIYGGLRIIQVCRDWPKWFREYFTGPNDGSDEFYRMRSGVTLHTRRNRSDFSHIDEIWAFRKYDEFGYRVAPGEVVVDIGGNIGTFSVYAASVCKASRVIAFEPFPENYKMLLKNVEQNKLDMVTCVNEAVAGSRGARTLQLDSADSGSHSLVKGASSGRTVEVQCCTLDDTFERFSLKKIDYLKVDCEGSEYEILENAKRLDLIGRISIEADVISNRRPEDLEKLLRKRGFDVKLHGRFLYATRLP